MQMTFWFPNTGTDGTFPVRRQRYGMEITVTVPDDLSAPLLPPGQEPPAPPRRPSASKPIAGGASPATNSAFYWASPRATSCYELDGFLKQHEVYDDTPEDFDHDLATIPERDENRKPKPLAMIVVADTGRRAD